MRTVVILHRIPYHKVNYHEVIDHNIDEVVYVVTESGADVDESIRHSKIFASSEHYVDDVLCAIYSRGLSIDAVIALSEYNLIHAAQIRASLGLANPMDVRTTYNARDKWLMKQCVSKCGIQAAEGALLESETGKALVEGCGKVVIKPTRGASSEKTYVGGKKAGNEFDGLVNPDECGDTFLVERFVEGDIYHFDGLVHSGQILLVVGSKYVGNCLEFANGRPLASVQIDNGGDYVAWVENCLRAVGIRNGAYHLEGIYANNGMCFLEVGARAGGAGVVSCTEKATGVNLMQEEVKMHLHGDNYTSPQFDRSELNYGWFVVPQASFDISTNEVDELRRIPGLEDLTLIDMVSESSGISYSEMDNPCTGIVSGRGAAATEHLIGEVLSLTCRKAAYASTPKKIVENQTGENSSQ